MKNTNLIFTSERAFLRKGNEYLMQQSIKRYNFAKGYCKGKKVLDMGSGEGYGINIISKEASLAVGIDYSFETIKHSRDKYKRENVYFVCGDCNGLPFRSSCFDIVVSFELIEHLSLPYAYLNEIVRVISEEGIYIGSTPQLSLKELDKNPFHKHPYSREEYKNVLLRYFLSVDILGEREIRKISNIHSLLRSLDILNLRNRLKIQILRKFLARTLGSIPFEEVTQKDFIIESEHVKYAAHLISICRGPKK